MFSKLFKRKFNKSEYNQLIISQCTHCYQVPMETKKCDNCKKAAICERCHSNGERLCGDCNEEYDKWASNLVALKN